MVNYIATGSVPGKPALGDSSVDSMRARSSQLQKLGKGVFLDDDPEPLRRFFWENSSSPDSLFALKTPRTRSVAPAGDRQTRIRRPALIRRCRAFAWEQLAPSGNGTNVLTACSHVSSTMRPPARSCWPRRQAGSGRKALRTWRLRPHPTPLPCARFMIATSSARGLSRSSAERSAEVDRSEDPRSGEDGAFGGRPWKTSKVFSLETISMTAGTVPLCGVFEQMGLSPSAAVLR